MGAAAIAGGLGIWLRWRWARVFGIVGASALVHMGFTDIAMFAQHDLYAHPSTGIRIMMVVDGWAVVVGALVIVTLGREQVQLGASARASERPLDG